MSVSEPEDRADLNVCEDVYGRLLEDVRDVSDRTLDRLRLLGDDLPLGLVEQLDRLHDDPARERRKSVRVADDSAPVWVRAARLPDGSGVPAVKDHSPTGLAVLLPCPAGVGSVLHVRLPPELGGDKWVAVEVKHCRREGDGWLAGCEILPDAAARRLPR
jgi:hypothetical protein